MDEVRRFEGVGLIYDEAKLGTNTSDAHDATKATPHAGESVTTASLSRDEWDEGRLKSSYVARGESSRQSIPTSREKTNHISTSHAQSSMQILVL